MAQHETRSSFRTSTRLSPTGSGLPTRNRAGLLEGSCSTSWSAASRPYPARDHEKSQYCQPPPATPGGAPRRAPPGHLPTVQKSSQLWAQILTVADKNEALMNRLLARMEAIDHRLDRLENLT
ncbi:hypothetical protein CERZMDRAFT_98879 [Cercospora zeae-maydis SCOH1-5]|uniref:Uncharacterized protein n=1 Tax=Cercospora zeae-maydis SCOH1-5 TaxID=717836 RepID=A0A6A6FD22_9PEZI|nr:hypothetical protein CERZMDRAFT_98879 [Cercospora zeae-maydis SCOH1-5]